MRRLGCLIVAATGLLYAAPPSFDSSVQPLLSKTCLACHNERLASGNLNIAPYLKRESLVDREQWDRILRKVRSGEMPPKGVPRPAQPQIEALLHYVESELEKAVRAVKPDPGRVTARRLNRNEYSNTIRDLLAVDFRAEKDFPTDDTAGGFDNIGDALSI